MAYRDDTDAHREYHALLRDIRIASPCPARWSDMDGDDLQRHCGECQKTVYNISAMRAEDAARLITQKGGRRCLRLYRRHDGTVLTADCPMGAQKKRIRRAVVLSTAGVLSTAFATALEPAYGEREPPTIRKAAPNLTMTAEERGKWILGNL